MAYTFPPRGFPQQENSQQIQPNSGRPPFPPYPPPRHVFHGTPMGNPTGHDIPSFGTENLQFGQRPPPPFMRFPNPRTVFRPPSHRGAWMGGPGPPMQFDTRTSQVRPCRPTSQFNQFSPTFTTDITTYESWPASSCQQPGKNAQQGQVGQAPQAHQGGPSHQTGQRSRTNQQNNSKGNEFSNQKKSKNRRLKKKGPDNQKGPGNQKGPKQKGQGNKTAQSLSSDATPYYCDVCDRGFKVQELLDDHLKQHTKCSHPGCRFEAHFKVVKSHVKMQHGPGSKKVAWLHTSEEITRWREERKRNYPSAANIAKKEEMSRNNKEQGVALQNKFFGKMRQHKNKRGKHQLKVQTMDQGMDAKKPRINMTDSSDLKPKIETESAKLPSGSLAALALAYDDSEDEVTELQQETEVTAVERHKQDASTNRPTNHQERFHNKYKQKNKGKNRKPNRGTRCGKQLKEKQRLQEQLRRRPNLLEMLLAPDIRHERNIILQCVRYVVQNDFFEIGEPNITQSIASEGPCLNATETNGTRQDYDVQDDCKTQVCQLKPEEDDEQTSFDSKDVVTMEEKSLVSQETHAGIKDETHVATNGDIQVGHGGSVERDIPSKVIENPQAESDINEIKEPVNNLIVLKDEVPIATNGSIPDGLGDE
ncbi:nuclear fragile X mental retardation-interacting protein 1-like [Asterias rubens]|uniref:nuclear fragile X mental retardation-interacting protein 1-like n=1 Tax=Asterias rubens TaxID=7604 RepID=UPI00145504BA|nr:nuclear fragile X mental retardation-interacting protein 1-like [Asterias rubens]